METFRSFDQSYNFIFDERKNERKKVKNVLRAKKNIGGNVSKTRIQKWRGFFKKQFVIAGREGGIFTFKIGFKKTQYCHRFDFRISLI